MLKEYTGSKMKSIKVVYTPWENLRKGAHMEIGAVGFHNEKNVKSRRVKKNKAVVKALNRTKREVDPDFEAERAERDLAVQQKKKIEEREARLIKEEEEKKAQHDREQAKRSFFDDLSSDDDEQVTSLPANYEDDFM